MALGSAASALKTARVRWGTEDSWTLKRSASSVSKCAQASSAEDCVGGSLWSHSRRAAQNQLLPGQLGEEILPNVFQIGDELMAIVRHPLEFIRNDGTTKKHGSFEPPASCAKKWSASASESR